MTSKLESAKVVCEWDTMMGCWSVWAGVTFDDSNSKSTDDNRDKAYAIADSLRDVLESYKENGVIMNKEETNILAIELSINTVKYFSTILDMHFTPDPEKELIEACKKVISKENK